MRKFRPIQTLAMSKRFILNHPKTPRFSERTSTTQIPKARSMRNLRFSSPPPAFGTFVDLNQRPNCASTKPKNAVSSSIHPKFKQKAEGKAPKTLRRLTTLNSENIYQKEVQALKQYISSLTLRQEQSKKQSRRGRKQLDDAALRQQRKQFLMGQVSFMHIDEQRVYAQKKYLERFQHLSKSVPRKIRQTILQSSSSGGNGYKILQCFHCIDRIYGLLREMQEVGYPLKTNKYVIKYCSSGKLWLKHVFLHESDEKRGAFTIDVKYLVNHNPQDTKNRFSEFAVDIRGEQLKVVQDELEGLYLHLQHSIAQKKANQVSSVANYIEGRLKQEGKNISQSLRLNYAPPDTMKLTDDLERIEQKFGALRNITKISRKKYDQLNRSQLKLQALL